MPKNYRASTGVDQFHYGVMDDAETFAATPERVKYLQTINVASEQTPTRAHGDNETAEIAVSSGNTTVSSAFHKLPLEDRIKLLGLEETAEGLSGYGGSDNPPYVGVVFSKTHEDGSSEWVGLPKGMFMRPNINGQTKAEGVSFGTDEISAEFMDREVAGFDKKKSVIFGRDADGVTVARDAIFQAVFGQAYPGETPVGGA